MTNAAIYARYSSNHQRDGAGLDLDQTYLILNQVEPISRHKD
jgi:hypothetical protein